MQALRDEHREIEVALEVMANSIAAGMLNMDACRRVRELCVGHYASEEAFLARLPERMAEKLRAQHNEALELAAVLAASEGIRDAMYLARRLVAIVQHNIIEEERDVFPFWGDV